jgi:hypothetical protein
MANTIMACWVGIPRLHTSSPHCDGANDRFRIEARTTRNGMSKDSFVPFSETSP